MSLRHIFKTSWRRLQCNNFSSTKTAWRRLTQTSSRRLAKMSSRRFQDISSSYTVLFNMLLRCLQDICFIYPEGFASVTLVTNYGQCIKFARVTTVSQAFSVGTRRLQDLLGLSWNCLVSIRHFQDIYKTSSCRWLAIEFPGYLNIILESSYLEKINSRCLNYVSIKMASIKPIQDCYMTEL